MYGPTALTIRQERSVFQVIPNTLPANGAVKDRSIAPDDLLKR